jgi:hypothetical protein|tara:strand:- start:149 stop:1231 length:1083 start_codon:yes stop_codon:yes gene_type:complete
MPFLTYTIEENLVEKIELAKLNNIDKFILRIEDLNYNKRAILINKKGNVLEKLRIKYLDLCEKIGSGEEHTLSETLINLTKVLNDSILCNIDEEMSKYIKIDFKKNLDNEINTDLFHKFNKDVYHPTSFDTSIKIFEEDFLDKIKTFIISENSSKKKINAIYVFHKETSKILAGLSGKKDKKPIKDTPIAIRAKDPNEHFTYAVNVNKIKDGTKILINWWKKIPNKFRPDKFIFLTDTPLKLSESHKFNIDAQNIMQKYLFDELDNKNFNFKLRFLDPFKLRRQWWKHKRHFAFSEGPKSINDSKNNNQPVSLLIDSEFGPEFVDEKDNSKINNINKFVVIKDSGNIHLIDISNEIANNI